MLGLDVIVSLEFRYRDHGNVPHDSSQDGAKIDRVGVGRVRILESNNGTLLDDMVGVRRSLLRDRRAARDLCDGRRVRRSRWSSRSRSHCV